MRVPLAKAESSSCSLRKCGWLPVASFLTLIKDSRLLQVKPMCLLLSSIFLNFMFLTFIFIIFFLGILKLHTN